MGDALTRESAREAVEWETVVRWPWDEAVSIELRAASLDDVEIKVVTRNACGGAEGSRRLKFSDVRRALDQLEYSAREVERLGD